jgi:hypothetical protein
MTRISGRSWTGTWPTASTATATRWTGRDSSPLPTFTPRPGRRGGRHWLRRRHRLRGRRTRQAAAPGMGLRATPRADPVRVSRGRDRTLSHRLQRPPHRGRRKAMGQTADTTLIGGRRLACSARHGQRAARQRLVRLTAGICAGAQRLRLLSVTGFPASRVLGWRSSRFPTDRAAWPKSLPCPQRSTLSAARECVNHGSLIVDTPRYVWLTCHAHLPCSLCRISPL